MIDLWFKFNYFILICRFCCYFSFVVDCFECEFWSCWFVLFFFLFYCELIDLDIYEFYRILENLKMVVFIYIC